MTRHPLATVSLGFLVLLVVAVVAAPLLSPADPLAQDLDHVLAGPSSAHPLGTDDLGRDVLSRLLHGGRATLIGVVEAVAVVLLLGVPIGLLAGYRGGWVDAAAMRATDVLLAVPVIIILLVVLATFGQSATAAMVTLGVLGAPAMIRVVRASSLVVRQEPYITAARVAGLSSAHIVRRHVLPRVAGPVVVQASLFAGVALLTETGLAFLGLGVQEPEPSWGGMVATASTVINQDPWLLVPAGVTIGLAVLALGLVGDAVRDAVTEHGAPGGHGREAQEAVAPGAEPERVGGRNGAGPSLLSLRGLTVAVGAATVVDGVSFDVRPGETVGLIGESGCGKTMTARAILGLLPPGGRITGGACRFDGADLVRASREQRAALRGREIALVSQEPVASLDPNYRVGHQIVEVIRCHERVSRREARRRAVDLLGRVRLPDPEAVSRRYPHQLSGGMAQRVCIAAALASGPRLLIADEPTTAVDVTVQAEILDLLRDLQRDTGMAILLVTHDWGVVADACDRTVVMYAGQVVESTAIGPMFRQPLHPYTDGLLRSDPHGAPVGSPLPAIPGTVPAPGAWPAGCHFHPRCRLATAACRRGSVPLVEPEGGRFTRCLHHERLVEEAHR